MKITLKFFQGQSLGLWHNFLVSEILYASNGHVYAWVSFKVRGQGHVTTSFILNKIHLLETRNA